jgi:membrane protease YdiL (CAAX protease family)
VTDAPAREEPFVHPPREALALLAVSSALFALARFGIPEGAPGSFLATIGPTLRVLAWTAPAYALAARRGQDPLVAHGLLARPHRLASSLALASLVLPLYAVGFLFIGGWRGGPLHLTVGPGQLAEWFAWHLAFAALPEEYLFRGVLQPALARGRPWWVGALAASALFALPHVAFERVPARALVFFPGLVFGWLRERTGSLAAPIFFHALCNALDETLHGGLG